MFVRRTMHVVLLLLCNACIASTNDDYITDIVQETIRYMLDFSDIPNATTSLPFRTSHRITATMQAIYDAFVEDDGSDDGNVVRGINPSVGKLDGQDVLLFDISGFEKEQIMRAELHFYLHRRNALKSGRARQLRAKSICLHEYCGENQQLEMITTTSEKVTWDATKPLAEANALESSQMIIRITRRDVRMRRYIELIKKCSPFLLVYSRAENTVDAEVVRKRVDGIRRKRRELGYHMYNSIVESTSPQSTHPTSEAPFSQTEIFERIPLHKRTQIRRSSKKKKKDIWYGFGEEDGEELDEEEQEEFDKMDKQVVKSNDVRTALLEADKEDVRCQKRGSLMNLASLGWGRWIIAPSTFEAGFCSGICPNPLPKEMHPSNHALLQSLLYSSTVPSVCCSPEHMRSLTLFYHDEYDRLTIKNFDNMLVESCACQ